MRKGYDYVGTIRRQRQDSWFRRHASRAMNRLRERITRIQMTDQGCMLRAYSAGNRRRHQFQCREINTFIPAAGLHVRAATRSRSKSGHEERAAGESKYFLYYA
jgi:undecaprenyl-phosphate 4-deoxy-4-formamido-L-arabinose transferase